MTGLLLVAVLGALALLYVSGPVARREHLDDESASAGVRDAQARKGAALDALLDIEEERELGKLEGPDYAGLRDLYEREAWEAIEEIDHGPPASGEDEVLEREVAAMRARLACPRCGSLRAEDGGCPACDDGR